jgi:hypothetical protein
MHRIRRVCATVLGFLTCVSSPIWGTDMARADTLSQPRSAYAIKLMNGSTATVFSDGSVKIISKDPRTGEPGVAFTRLRPSMEIGVVGEDGGSSQARAASQGLFARQLQASLQLNKVAQSNSRPFIPNSLIIVYRSGITAPDTISVVPKQLSQLRSRASSLQSGDSAIPTYTNDAFINVRLAKLGVDASDRLFQQMSKSSLESFQAGVDSGYGNPSVDLANVYRLHLTNSSVENAILLLSNLPSVAYVTPDWLVGDTAEGALPVTNKPAQALQSQPLPPIDDALAMTGRFIPKNYAVANSSQSLLNAPGLDAVAAADEIESLLHQLPGTGEIVTDVSLGDLDDASASTDPKNPCNPWVAQYGPTTVLQGEQRYLDWPSLPLIPTYVSDRKGALNGKGEVCGVDPELSTVGRDLSVMAPLPDDDQRAGASSAGQGYADLLGIAPGAQYRLVVPGGAAPTSFGEALAAFLAASMQTPRPDVITSSIALSFAGQGFPDRYLEDDPIAQKLISSIVKDGIVVCLPSGDGLTPDTPAAVGPSGGSAATNIAGPGQVITRTWDLALSTQPALLKDSGAIDVGGVTLDDVFADPGNSYQTFPATRWDGSGEIASGYGTRVNVAAPADSISGLQHTPGSSATTVEADISTGTSAATAETAAAAVIALQVARLTGKPLANPAAVRSLLESTGTDVLQASQVDQSLNVGPQLNLRRLVETLLKASNKTGPSRAVRVAVAQRQSAVVDSTFDNQQGANSGLFLTGTNADDIDLADGYYVGTGENSFAPITIAPDWEFIPAGARYQLMVNGKILARTPWARLYPEDVLAAAGQRLASSATRRVKLVYEALIGRQQIRVPFTLGFGPSTGRELAIPAPIVQPVVTGDTFTVSYDLTHTTQSSPVFNPPLLTVSLPGRFSGENGLMNDGGYYAVWSTTVPANSKGTVKVPVSALKGSGIYGINIFTGQLPPGQGILIVSGRAITRVVARDASTSRPGAPQLSATGLNPSAFLEVPLAGDFHVSYDVSKVPKATGAALEISAGGPTVDDFSNTFNNPNGSVRDNDGVNTGSVYYRMLPGVQGQVVLNSAVVGLTPGLIHNIRVIPMTGGVAAGEASDVSSVTMDGIVPPDGGFIGGDGTDGLVNAGFGIDQQGTDGLMATVVPEASGESLSDIYTFSQNGKSFKLIGTSEFPLAYLTVGSGIFGKDVGLISAYGSDAQQYNVINPVSDGLLNNAWVPPFLGAGDAGTGIVNAADNQSTPLTAFILDSPKVSKFSVFTSNIGRGTFGKLLDATGLNPASFWGEIGIDPSLNLAFLAGYVIPGGLPAAETLDLSSGAIKRINFSGGSGSCEGVTSAAVDAVAHKAFFGCSAGGAYSTNLYSLDLASEGLSMIPLRGANPVYGALAVDSTSKRVLVFQGQSPDEEATHSPDVYNWPGAQDLNALDGVEVYDEGGHYIESIAKFNTNNVTFYSGQHYLQVNPEQRIGYYSNGGTQLIPFKY